MTPAEAAAELELALGASEAEVREAYRVRARQSHPDRFADADADTAREAAARFIRVTEARDVLLALQLAPAGGRIPAPAVGTPLPPQPSRRLMITWIALLPIGIAVSMLASDFPLTIAEPLIRFAALGVGASLFAATGARPWWVLMWIAIAATALETILFTTLGSLLGMLLLAAPIYGLAVIGWTRRQRAALLGARAA